MTRDLDRLLEPRSMVVIGASARAESLSHRLLVNVAAVGAPGDVHLVNPRQREIDGRPCLSSVRDLPAPVDLAVISVPAAAVADELRAVAEVGIRNAIVYTSGFAELSDEGAEQQRELAALAGEHGMNVLGPNCMGNLNLVAPACSTFTEIVVTEPCPAGPFALVSQSGGVALATYSLCVRAGIGISHLVSTGNQADLTSADVLSWLASDESTSAVGVYAENIVDGARFLAAAAQLRTAGKTLIVLKSGRTAPGSAAVQSHTGALATDWAVTRELFAEAGVVVVESPQQLATAAGLALSMRPFPRGRRVTVLASSGGTAVLAADLSSETGLELAPLAGRTTERLRAILPPFAPLNNPLDVSAAFFHDASTAADLLATLADDPDSDVLAVVAVLRSPSSRRLAAAVAPLLAAGRMPAMVGWLGGDDETRQPFADAGVCYDTDLARLFDTFRRLAAAAARPVVEPDPSPVGQAGFAAGGPSGWRTEPDLKRSLAGAGIRVPRFAVADDLPAALRFAESAGAPVVVKLVSAAVPHRARIGALALDLHGAADITDAWQRLSAIAAEHEVPDAAMLIEEMAPAGPDVFVGFQRETPFGPVVALGIGGGEAEELGRVTFVRAPLTEARIDWVLERVPAFGRLLDGPARRAIRDALPRIAAWCAEQPELVLLDLNPIRVVDGCAVVLDALGQTGRAG